MENGCAILPTLNKGDPNGYYDKCYDSCYWSNDCLVNDESINSFIEKAKEYNYTEEQALAILIYNGFDQLKSDCDLKIYQPIKGFNKINLKHAVKLISDGIIKNLRSREHRDFEEIIYHFPGYSIGDLLEFYSRNRLKIKKQTGKTKKILRKINHSHSSFQPINIKIPTSVTNGNCLNGNNWLHSKNELFRLVYSRQYNWIKEPEEMICQIESENNGYNSMFTIDGNCHNNNDKSKIPDIQLLNYLKRANKKRKYRNKRLKSSSSEIIGLIGLDSEQLGEIIDREYKNSNSDDQAIRMVNDKSSFRDKFVHYIKSGHENYEGEPDIQTSKSETDELHKNLCKRHENILYQYQSIVPKPSAFQKLKHTWSNIDFALLLLGLMRFGLDFCRISDIIMTKSETMVRSFYFNYRQQYDLDRIITDCSKNVTPPNTMVTSTDISSNCDDSLQSEEFIFRENYQSLTKACVEQDKNTRSDTSTLNNVLSVVVEPVKMTSLSVNIVETESSDKRGMLKVEKHKYIPSPMCPGSGSTSESEKPGSSSSTIKVTEKSNKEHAEFTTSADDNEAETSNMTNKSAKPCEESSSTKLQLRKTIETRMSARSKEVRPVIAVEPTVSRPAAQKRGLALVSSFKSEPAAKETRSKQAASMCSEHSSVERDNDTNANESSDKEAEEEDAYGGGEEEEVVLKRVLRDRKSTNERFKTIIDAERRARNRKNYPRKRKPANSDQETPVKTARSSGRK